MASNAPPDRARTGPGLLQGVLQFFTSVTGITTAFVGLLATVVGLAAAQYEASDSSSSSNGRSSSDLVPPGTKEEGSIGRPIDDTASNWYVDLVEAQITPQLQAQMQANVPDAVVSVDSLECSPPGDGGGCTAGVSDSIGYSATVKIAYTLIEPTTGAFQWWAVAG